jgi:predicted RNase H-like HicB family nuclease
MTYEVVITREGDNWLADVPSVPGAHTFARSLPSLYESVREVIVLMDDLDDDDVPPVVYTLEVDDPLLKEAADLGRARAEVAELESSVKARTGKTVAKLTQSGYSMRDVAALVGLTPGRISQMTPQSR